MAVQDFLTNPNMQIGKDLLEDPAILDLLGQEGVMDKVFDPSVYTPGTTLAGSVLPGDPFDQDISPDMLQLYIDLMAANNKTPAYSGTNLVGAGPIATGQQYAQSIAGGMPFEQVVAPGMSFSPEFPMGYTQADLTAPIIPPIVDDGPTPPPMTPPPPPDEPPIDAPPIFLPPKLPPPSDALYGKTPLEFRKFLASLGLYEFPNNFGGDEMAFVGGSPTFDYRGETLIPETPISKPQPPISIGGPGGLLPPASVVVSDPISPPTTIMPSPELTLTPTPEPIYSALPVGPSIPFVPSKPPMPPISVDIDKTIDQIVSPIRTGRQSPGIKGGGLFGLI